MACVELQYRLLDKPWVRCDGRWQFEGKGLRVIAGRGTRISGRVGSLAHAGEVLNSGDVINVWGRLEAPGEVSASRISVDESNRATGVEMSRDDCQSFMQM